MRVASRAATEALAAVAGAGPSARDHTWSDVGHMTTRTAGSLSPGRYASLRVTRARLSVRCARCAARLRLLSPRAKAAVWLRRAGLSPGRRNPLIGRPAAYRVCAEDA
ncbi:hypothetical protein [Streptomyces brevispora]|uniref:hypothetical protein n=1 Tax=Streptomyces brevispora TaxID=887462 RepID=UPI0035DF2C64